jgi:transposase InsO family protein
VSSTARSAIPNGSPTPASPPRSEAGQSYDNALAETVNGLYKAELIYRRPRWRTVEEVELATADWVAFWNHRRLHSATDYLPPAEYERAYWRQQAEPIEAA